MDDLLHDSLSRLFASHCTPAFVRSVEAGGTTDSLWHALSEFGITDSLVPEVHGGSGMALRDLFGIAMLCGEACCPAPLMATIIARSSMAGQVAAPPEGPVTIAAFGVLQKGQSIEARQVPFARTAQWVLLELSASNALLLPISSARMTSAPINGSLAADLVWERAHGPEIALSASLRPALAAIVAAMMAGAMLKTQAMSLAYANDRVQFGKPIAKFQAIQQQLSELAEEVAAARMAAEIGLSSSSQVVNPDHAALAKMRASLAVPVVAAIAHAVHGAMGITQDYDLQLLTRRLHEWRMTAGAESYWAARLGEHFLQQNSSFLDHIRQKLTPSAEEGDFRQIAAC